jgi:uncharacterized SAM-binding protein YcdF (DUF218 family)
MIGKLFALMVSPLGTSLFIGSIALLLLLFVRSLYGRKLGSVLAVFSFGWLWIWSTPLVSDAFRGKIESMAGPRSVDDVASADVIVVLGGGVSGSRPPLRLYPDLGSASDRVWYASRLYKAGKGSRIVLSGGVVSTGDGSEAAAMRRFLLDLGVPEKVILEEDGSVNTVSNALYTRERLKRNGIDRIILVTSALHMPRSRRIFERTGFKVIAAPTDFEVIDMPFSVFRFLPDAGALEGSAHAMKEVIGYVFAR